MYSKISLIRCTLVALLTSLASGAFAATYYVATTGSNTAGDGSTSKPWGTIGYGVGKLASGDTLVVKAGTYTNLANFIQKIPAGTASAYTTVMAETPFSVRIKNSGSLNYYDNLVQMSTNYTKVDGFILEVNDTPDPEHIAAINGNFNKLTRVIFKRTGPTNQYGGWLNIDGSDNLVEDCAGVGSARYGFAIGGPDSTAQRNIMRRCVGRVDYSVSDQPKAVFNVYGNNSGTNMRDVLLQNCIAIDSKAGPSRSEPTYGGFYFPKNAANVTVQGSLVLNVEAAYAGFFVKELNGQNLRMTDSVAWAGTAGAAIDGIRANASAAGYYELNHVTVGGYRSGYYNAETSTTETLSNSLFYGNGSLASADQGWTSVTNNAFYPSSQSKGTNAVAATASVLKYIVRPESGTVLSAKGTDGKDIGANLTKRYGKTGTRWGEAGYDQLTTESLWPWTYEATIKTVFAEPHSAPSGAVPSSNNSVRGFTVATDQFGKPMTLTRYVWQFLGNEIPADIYGTSTSALQSPTGVTAVIVSTP